MSSLPAFDPQLLVEVAIPATHHGHSVVQPGETGHLLWTLKTRQNVAVEAFYSMSMLIN